MSVAAQAIRLIHFNPNLKADSNIPPQTNRYSNDAGPFGHVHGESRTVKLLEGQELFEQDSPIHHYYRIEAGCIRTVRLMEDGRRMVERFLFPGDLLAFGSGTHYSVSAQAVIPTVARSYSCQAIRGLAEKNAEFASFLWRAIGAEQRVAREHGLSLGRMTAIERVAGFLHEMARRMVWDARQGLTLPMGRTDIADHLCLAVETISRALTQLRRDGAITIMTGGYETDFRSSRKGPTDFGPGKMEATERVPKIFWHSLDDRYAGV